MNNAIHQRRYVTHLSDPDRELALDFLLSFARLEYALKRAGYFFGDSNRADVNWKEFATKIAGRFESDDSPALNSAIDYLVAQPPKKQIVNAREELDWKSPERNPSDTLESWVLSLLRIARNNLFHGGKFPYPHEMVPEPARDRTLLRACLSIIDACLRFDPEVSHFFEDAA